MRIVWEIDDGYVGGKRPQSFELNEIEFQDCETFMDCMDVVFQRVEEEFQNHTGWYLENTDSIHDDISDFLDRRREEYVETD